MARKSGMLSSMEEDDEWSESFDDIHVSAPKSEPTRYHVFRPLAQRFMDDYRPLFEAFAREVDEAEGLVEGGKLEEAMAASNALSIELARRFLLTPNPASIDIAHFRAAASGIVASTWRDEGMRGFDHIGAAEEAAAALHMVEEEARHSKRPLNTRLSSAMNVVAILLKAVSIYDFRRDRTTLLADMCNEVIDIATKSSSRMLPPDVGSEEADQVLTDLSERLAHIMSACYERKAKQAVAHLSSMPETERENFARRYDPMPSICEAFREHANLFVATAVACALAMTKATNRLTTALHI
jgi:hypothetical protein